jgi:Periplasmic component of the Tol biopolymer transport system
VAKGSIIKNIQTIYTDEHTGIKITRLTEPTHISHHMYFYNRMTTKGTNKLLYAAEFDGERQLYLMDMKTGEAVQMTEGADVGDYNGMISADYKYVFYQQQNTFYKMDIETLEAECIYQSPAGWKLGSPGLSDDDRYMAVVETKEDTIAQNKKNSGNWDFFAKNCLAKPLCRIVYVDIEKKTSHIVLQDNCWFGHVQIRPKDADTILFCHEGPYDLIDARLWLVQKDGSNYRRCREQDSTTILTHEFWMPDGAKFAYVYRETSGERIENIRMMNPKTLEEEILMPCSPYAHFISDKKGKYMVGDAQGSELPIHLLTDENAHIGSENDYIYLVDVAAKKEMKLCWHGTSWRAKHGNPQDSHPHPCFTEDNESVIFVSDKDGKPCIYKVDIKDMDVLIHQ